MARKLEKIYPWIVVALLWVVALLNYMDRQMLSTMREYIAVDIAQLQQAEAFGVLMAIPGIKEISRLILGVSKAKYQRLAS